MIKPICYAPAVGVSFDKGWEVFKKNFGIILLAFLITMLISAVSCGICGAPMSCGLMLMILGAMRDPSRPMQVGDVFNGFHYFGPAFLVSLVLGLVSFAVSCLLGIIPVLGFLASVVLSYASGAMVMWGIIISGDQNATVGEAIGTPFKLLGDGRFWGFIGVYALATLIGVAGILLCGIGVLATMPLAFCIIAAAYEACYQAPAPVASIPPPPPPSQPYPQA